MTPAPLAPSLFLLALALGLSVVACDPGAPTDLAPAVAADNGVEEPAFTAPPVDYTRLARLYKGFPLTAPLWRDAALDPQPLDDSSFVATTDALTRAYLRREEDAGALTERSDYIARRGCIDLDACTYFELPTSTVFRADDTTGSIGAARRIVCAKNQPDETDCDNFVYFAVPAARVRGYVSTSAALDAAIDLQSESGGLDLSAIDASTCAVVLGSRTIIGLALQGEAAPGAALERNFRVVVE